MSDIELVHDFLSDWEDEIDILPADWNSIDDCLRRGLISDFIWEELPNLDAELYALFNNENIRLENVIKNYIEIIMIPELTDVNDRAVIFKKAEKLNNLMRRDLCIPDSVSIYIAQHIFEGK